MTDNINIGEIGTIIRVNVGKDITSSVPTLILLPEYGNLKEFTEGVTIPNVDYTFEDTTLCAGEYIEYAIKQDDLDYVGRWKKKAKLTYSAVDVQETNYVKFRVLP